MTKLFLLELGESLHDTILEPKQPKEFAVKVDDRGKLYLKSLTDLIKKHVNLNSRNVRNIEPGDFVVFTKNDIYVEENRFALLQDGIKVLSLINDYDKVISYVSNFFKTNTLKKKSYVEEVNLCDFCPLKPVCDTFTPTKNIIRNGEFINVEEKVSILYNCVKVGYDLYRIRTQYGKKYVEIEDYTFEVKSNFFGEKYLQLI